MSGGMTLSLGVMGPIYKCVIFILAYLVLLGFFSFKRFPTGNLFHLWSDKTLLWVFRAPLVNLQSLLMRKEAQGVASMLWPVGDPCKLVNLTIVQHLVFPSDFCKERCTHTRAHPHQDTSAGNGAVSLTVALSPAWRMTVEEDVSLY